MRKLNGTDASFLYNETITTPQHVGGIQYLEVPKHRHGTFFDDLKALVQERIHLLPYLTTRMQTMPWDIDHPAWVRYPKFDIDEHLHAVTLQAPGTIEQLEKLAAELYEPLLDRAKPLWEWWVVDGLENGQIAVVQKTHHACIDGMASVTVQEVLGDFSSTPRAVEPPAPEFWAHDDVSAQTLLRESWANLAKYEFDRWVRWPERVAANARAVRSTARDAEAAARPSSAPKAPWNASIDPKRGIAGTQFSLSKLKAIGKQTGTKINDVVLAITAEALNRYLSRHNVALQETMIAGCPVSLRKRGDQTMNNQVTMMTVSLESHVADPVERLRAIHKSANAAKRQLADLGDSIQSDFGGPFVPATMQAAARAGESGAFANAAPRVPVNLVVSNVPGLRVPVYSAGAKVVGMTPMSIVSHGAGLNVTVTSYVDRMDLGITTASKLIPDVHAMLADFTAAYEDLVERVLGTAIEHVGTDADLAMAAGS